MTPSQRTRLRSRWFVAGLLIASIGRPLRRALCTVLIGIAALWALPTSARAQLYLTQPAIGTVSEYDATTGAPINASLITGLDSPFALALEGNTLFVANRFTVGAYDATTGAANVKFSPITGLDFPLGLTVSGNTLFMPNSFSDTVGTYNAASGALINADFITGLDFPLGLAVASLVPEPSPWPMMAGSGVALLTVMLRRKRRTA
jgi:hypothetical protein